MISLRRVAIVGTPFAAVAILAVGLRVGARHPVHAATVYGAPKSAGSDAFVWQLVTVLDDRGVRETEAVHGVTVHARAVATNREATWQGDTNEDGVAEVRLDLPGVANGEAIALDVRAAGVAVPLAQGDVAWGDDTWTRPARGPFLRPSKREGTIGLDVAVLGERILGGAGSTVLVRATSRVTGHPMPNVAIDADPEGGFDVAPTDAKPTCALGWKRFRGTARMFVAATAFRARAPDGQTGEWDGAFPVAHGAPSSSDRALVETGAFTMTLETASARTEYLEVDDPTGRQYATVVTVGDVGDLKRPPTEPIALPAMTPGFGWIVLSSEPRGAERLADPALALPTLFAGPPGASMPPGLPDPKDTCAVEDYLALHPASGFARWTALDGFTGRNDIESARRKRGLSIALMGLGATGLVELALVVDAFLRTRRAMKDAATSLDSDDAALLTRRSSSGGLLVSLFVVLLGFALLAGLLLLRDR